MTPLCPSLMLCDSICQNSGQIEFHFLCFLKIERTRKGRINPSRVQNFQPNRDHLPFLRKDRKWNMFQDKLKLHNDFT